MTFSEKMRELMNQGIEASREIVAKASTQAQVWGEMGALRVEILQLRRQAEKLVAKLGTEVYAAFGERGEASLGAQAVAGLVSSIAELEKRIDEKEAAFRKLGGKDSDLKDD